MQHVTTYDVELNLLNDARIGDMRAIGEFKHELDDMQLSMQLAASELDMLSGYLRLLKTHTNGRGNVSETWFDRLRDYAILLKARLNGRGNGGAK